MPTKFNGNIREVRALNAYICLYRATESINHRICKDFKQDGFTPSQFSLLECLYHHGPMSPTILAIKTMRTCGNMTFVLDKLENKDWLQRKVNPKERRSYTIYLLEKGKKMVEKWLPIYVNNIVVEMNSLNKKEQETLRYLSRTIGLGTKS